MKEATQTIQNMFKNKRPDVCLRMSLFQGQETIHVGMGFEGTRHGILELVQLFVLAGCVTTV